MIEALFLLFSFLQSGFRNRTELALENLALRQQLAILKRERPHARLRRRDRLFWECLSSVWQRWRESLIVVKPVTGVRWHRKGFVLYWTRLSKHGAVGRPGTGKDIRKLVCKMADAIATAKIICRPPGANSPKYGILARHSHKMLETLPGIFRV